MPRASDIRIGVDPGVPAGTRPVCQSKIQNPKSKISRASGAFSLTEMLVAIAVMIVALAVVTNVFSISAKTAGTAQAIAEVEGNLQRFGAEFKADMKGISTAESVLVILGRTQAAAKNEDLRQAGRRYRVLVGDPTLVPGNYNPSTDPTPQSVIPGSSPRDQFSDPRADILMTFTTTARSSRQPASATLPGNALFDSQRALQRGANFAPVQLVLGHTAFGTPTRSGAGAISFPPTGNLKHIETQDAGENPLSTISELPVNRWVLGARRTLIEDDASDFGVSRLPALGRNYPIFKDLVGQGENGTAGSFRPTWERITQGYTIPGSPQASFAVDSVAFRYHDFLTFFSPRLTNMGTLVNPPAGLALANPYDLSMSRRWDGGNGATRQIIDNIMYHPDPRSLAHHHVLTLADRPLPELAANQAMAALPGCAWFQVEFLMPEDPRNSLATPISNQRDDMPRWVEVEPGKTYVFVPDSQENRELIASQVDANGVPVTGTQWDRLNTFAQLIPPQSAAGTAEVWQTQNLNRASNRRIRTWPYAIRVTVKVFDTGGKLDEPVTRTFVHRFDE